MPAERRLRVMVARLARRLGNESGIGLIELLIALTVLTIAIGALLAVFAGSILSLTHSSKEGTAVTLADRQLESYRSMPYTCIPASLPATAPAGCGVYVAFPNPYSGNQVTSTTESPDHRSYRITTTVSAATATSTQIKTTVTLATGGPVLAQETSYFSSAGTAPT